MSFLQEFQNFSEIFTSDLPEMFIRYCMHTFIGNKFKSSIIIVTSIEELVTLYCKSTIYIFGSIREKIQREGFIYCVNKLITASFTCGRIQ